MYTHGWGVGHGTHMGGGRLMQQTVEHCVNIREVHCYTAH